MYPNPTAPSFKRTKITWLAYLGIAYYTYFLNILGPVTPFLRSASHPSYTLSGLYFSAFATGEILNGIILSRVTKRYGVNRLVWLGMVSIVGGALLMITQNPIFILLGTFLMGMIGVFTVSLLNPVLVRQYGQNSPAAFTEASLLSGLFAVIAPVAVSFFSRTAFTWRASLFIMIPVVVCLWLTYRKTSLSAVDEQSEQFPVQKNTPAPILYWLYWSAILLEIAIEFCIIYWASDYLIGVVELSPSVAALGVSAYLGSVLAGRIVNRWLLTKFSPINLLMCSLFFTSGSFLIFWTASSPLLAILGLSLMGLGASGLYPILSSSALSAVPGNTIVGSGRISIAVGVAILILPFILGRLADLTNIRWAFGLVLLLLVVAMCVVQCARILEAKGLCVTAR